MVICLCVVKGTADSKGTGVHNVGVDHGGFYIFVAEEFLNGADVVAGFQEMGGKGVAECMWRDAFVKTSLFCSSAHGFLQAAFVSVVTSEVASARVRGESWSGEEPLPGPFMGGVGVFSVYRVGHRDAGKPLSQVVFVDAPGLLKLHL